MSKVLVISSTQDSHIPYVQQHLSEEIWVYDPMKFPDETDITYSFEGQNIFITSEGRVFNECNSIWFRKPSYLDPEDLPIETQFQQFVHETYMHGVRALYDLLKYKFWMSDFRSIIKANNKLYQLEIAHRLGFNVPNTIVTSNPAEAARFKKNNHYVVAKSLEFSPVEIDGIVQGFFTTRLDPNEETDFTGLELAPTIFQQEIRNKQDIRVTVVGNKTFPCKVTPVGKYSNSVDWREGMLTEDISYEPVEISTSTSDKCIALVKALGLTFGVVEFALDSYGTPWFLEINPNGQWAFIEKNTELPISLAIAKALERR